MEPSSGELRELRLRYSGVCVKCGTALPQGAQALYHAPSKTVRCVTCPDGPVSSEAALIDVGTAGACAGREHDRRAEKRQAAVKGRFGNRLGGAILALSDEPQSIRAWAQGARGEQELADALADVPGLLLLNDRRVPGTRGNIDDLLIAPAGVFVVDAKRYKGSLQIRDKGASSEPTSACTSAAETARAWPTTWAGR